MKTGISTFAVAATLASFATVAPAQTPLPLGESQSGRISTESELLTENIYYLDSYIITGEAGERIEITMQSEDFDTLLEIGRIEDDRFVELGRDDDGAGELDSRLVYTFPQNGNYIVRARTFGAGDTGTYLIEANRLPPPPPPPPPTAIRRGQTVDGELSAESPAYAPDDFGGAMRHYGLYSLRGEAGQTVTVTMRSDDFDSFLEVGGMTPLGFAVQDSNDDGQSGEGEEALGLNSRLTVTFQQAGTMMIRATTLGGNTTGAYSLTVE